MWLFAVKAILADRAKLVNTLCGVAFAVTLVNLQGGMLLGMLRKASMLVEFGRADVWVGHRHLTHVDVAQPVPERWVHRLRGLDGVERAEPYVISYELATTPDGRFTYVSVVGCEPAALLGNAWSMHAGDAAAVRDPDAVLVDVYDAPKLGNCGVGDVFEINRSRARVAGLTRGIVGFTTTPYVFTSLTHARAKFTRLPPDACSYLLVTAAPGTDVADLCRRIRGRVPGADVYDRPTYAAMSVRYWLTRTGLGLSFGLSALLGLLVGMAVVAQTLYASVTERIKEFAALKALGAGDGPLAAFVLAQAVGAAVIGSAIGLLVAAAVARFMDSPRAPVLLTANVAVLSVALVVPVCLVSAWLPVWRVRGIDPAAVLRGVRLR